MRKNGKKKWSGDADERENPLWWDNI